MEKNSQKNYAYTEEDFVEGIPLEDKDLFLFQEIKNIRNNLRPLNNIGIINQENRYRIKKYKEYDIDSDGRNTNGLMKPSTGYYKMEGNYANNNERNKGM